MGFSMEEFREKLDQNMESFRTEWYRLNKGQLIGYAQEIDAVRIAYNELYSGYTYSEEQLEYLLRFDNPLEVVRDKWIDKQCRPDVSEAMSHVLSSVMTDPDIEREYALNSEYELEQSGGMTLC
jgi:hypothetical protein